MWTQNPLMAVFLASLTFLFFLTHAQNSPQDYIALHNSARAQVGIGPMTWNDTVAAYAQAYANQRINDCALVHSSGPYGENIAVGYYPEFSGADGVNLWVAEKLLYDYASNSCKGGECGHYTQMVWETSVHLGCARVVCQGKSQFVVCNYDPPGNYIGLRPYDSSI